MPSALQRLEHAEQVARLLRGEDRGRLVEHEDPRVAVQRAQDLHALLHADADVLDARVGVDGQAVAVGQLAHARAGALDVEQQPRRGSLASTMFSATVMTGTSMKCWWTMPMPRSMASSGDPMLTGRPSTRTSPSSGV